MELDLDIKKLDLFKQCADLSWYESDNHKKDLMYSLG